MRKTWFDMKAASGDTPAVISIYDEIGMWGVTAKDFIASLGTVSGDNITLNINSPGGSVFDALTIFNALKKSGKKVTVCVMGIAASAASYIAMAGDKIIMPENTFMMVHNPLNAIYGNAEDMREMADVLDKIGDSLTATYVARTGLSDDEVRDLLAKDSYLTAAECLELGFADEVTAAVNVTATFEREDMPANIQALFKPQVQTTFADQVDALATAAELSEYAGVFAVSFDTTEKVVARIAECREIKALCSVAKCADKAGEFISSGKPLVDVRTALCDVLAAASTVDTTQTSSKKPVQDASPSAVTTAGIWASRSKHLRS